MVMSKTFQKHQGPQTALTFSHHTSKKAFLLKFKLRCISLYSVVRSKHLCSANAANQVFRDQPKLRISNFEQIMKTTVIIPWQILLSPSDITTGSNIDCCWSCKFWEYISLCISHLSCFYSLCPVFCGK